MISTGYNTSSWAAMVPPNSSKSYLAAPILPHCESRAQSKGQLLVTRWNRYKILLLINCEAAWSCTTAAVRLLSAPPLPLRGSLSPWQMTTRVTSHVSPATCHRGTFYHGTSSTVQCMAAITKDNVKDPKFSHWDIHWNGDGDPSELCGRKTNNSFETFLSALKVPPSIKWPVMLPF